MVSSYMQSIIYLMVLKQRWFHSVHPVIGNINIILEDVKSSGQLILRYNMSSAYRALASLFPKIKQWDSGNTINIAID